MIQLLEKKTGIRIIVFTLLLTILAWFVPVNIGQANAQTTDESGTTLLEQIINVPDTFVKTYGDSPFDLQATAPGSLSYSSNNREVASVSGGGVVTIRGVGTVTITIMAGATDIYQSAIKYITITVRKGTQTIFVDSTITKKVTDPSFSLGASTSELFARLSYESSNPKVATVSPSGYVTIIGEGTTTITVTAAETADCLAATKQITLTVEKSAQTISGPSTLLKHYGDEPFALGVKAESLLSYESSNPRVATVDVLGRVTIVGAGTTTFTVKAKATDTFSEATKTILLTVEKSEQTIEGTTAYRKAYGDSPFKINAKAEGSLTYESQNPEIAKVGTDGTVTVTGVGTAVIEITAAATSNFKEAKKSVQIIVKKGKQSIQGASSFTKSDVSAPFSLGASATGNLTYQSSNTKVAAVSQDGIVTIKGPGKATITITAEETEQYQAATKRVSITAKSLKPKTVAIKSAKSAKEGQLTISWKKVSSVSGYQVVLGQDKSCTSGKKVKTVSSKASSVTVKSLAKGTTYYAKVRAYKTISGKKYYGNYSKVKSAKIKGVKSLTAADLKKYQNKNFYKANKDLDGVAVYFKKASGNKLKMDITDGNLLEPDFGNHTWDRKLPITGTIHGNTLKFKDAQFYGTAFPVEGDGPQLVKMAKLSGTITFVNSKTIKLKITSGKNYTKYYSQQKKWLRLKPGKTITLKRSSNIDRQMGF